jgi:hypothetical protein
MINIANLPPIFTGFLSARAQQPSEKVAGRRNRHRETDRHIILHYSLLSVTVTVTVTVILLLLGEDERMRMREDES